jgi:hypothetical protein
MLSPNPDVQSIDTNVIPLAPTIHSCERVNTHASSYLRRSGDHDGMNALGVTVVRAPNELIVSITDHWPQAADPSWRAHRSVQTMARE